MNTIKHSEEYNGRVTLFLTNGHKVEFETEKLITFIEENKLNVEYSGSGLVCDPFSIEEETEIDVEKYLDDNFDEVVEQYYKLVICK